MTPLRPCALACALVTVVLPLVPITSAAARTTTRRPAGPAADISEEINGGDGAFIDEPRPPALKKVGYVEHEFVASGTATDYRAVGGLTPDGRWTFEPDTSAAYRTRILVRRPAKAAAFSGTVVLEWFNTSAGADAAGPWVQMSEEITRRGDIWVGVTTQLIGVEGGPVLVKVPLDEDFPGKGLKGIDPARYGTLVHPGDGYSYDIYTQVARALRSTNRALGGEKATRILAAGESQAAVALTDYYDGVQPLTDAFDGFLIHSRASGPLPLVAPGAYANVAASFSGAAVTFRTDLDAPVLDLQAESDVTGLLDSFHARQPDSKKFRLWEVAGTSHVDAHLVSARLEQALVNDCGAPLNDGPMHFVGKAALHALDIWVRSGTPPPKAPRIQLTNDDPPQVRRDSDGIAIGGIRTPLVDAPVDVVSGAPPPGTDAVCRFVGSTTPLGAERLTALYPSRASYTKRFAAALDRAIKRGFVLAADRRAMLDGADPSRIAS